MLGSSQKKFKDLEVELMDTDKTLLRQESVPNLPPTTADDTTKSMRKGIYLRVLSALCTLIFYAFRKLLPDVSSMQYTFDRTVCCIILMSIYFYFTKQFHAVKSSFERKAAYNSIIMTFADVASAVAMMSLPVSEIATIFSTMTIFNGIIGSYILGEPYLRIERILGGISFFGVFLIVRPPFIFGSEGAAEDAPAGLLPRYLAGVLLLCCAMIYSFLQIQMREMQKRMTSFLVVYYFYIGAAVLLAFYFVLIESRKTLTLWELTVTVGASVFHVANLILLAQALKLMKPTLVGLVGYLNLVISPVIDLVFFGTLPSIYTVLGAILIVGSCVKLLLMKSK